MTKEEEHIARIVEGCRNGDRKAQEELYRSFYRVMMTFCLRYTKNEADAMEVLNTGFYKVYKHIDRFDSSKAGLYTWIRTIIINSCLDFIRTNHTLTGAGELGQAANIHVPPAAISSMSATEILKMVRELPPVTQAVFNLYVMEGYNHREIGELLKMSDGTSKWHLREARKKLQAILRQSTNQ